MSKPAGNFDCAELLQVQVKIDQLWSDAQANQVDFIAEVTALNTIKQNQTARFPVLEGQQEKDLTQKIVWLTDCEDDDPQDCSDRCDLGGANIESDCKTYDITQCTKRGFTIPENIFRTSMYSREEVLARQLMMKMKAIEEAITRDVIALIATFKGDNKMTFAPGVVSGGDTYIDAPYWDANLFGYLYEVAIRNRMRNSYLLSGRNLFQNAWQIQMQAANAQNGAADLKKLSTIPIVNDLFNIDSVMGDPTTFMINRNSVAFVTKNRYGSTPIQVGTKQFYSIASKNIPGLIFDVGQELRCANDDFFHDVSLWANWDVFQNPTPCDATMTGLLTFLCGKP